MATEILRPNGAGHRIELQLFPDTGEANWEDVDEAIPDEDATYVGCWNGGFPVDYYTFTDPTFSPDSKINSVTFYARFKYTGSPGSPIGRIYVYKDPTYYLIKDMIVTTSYVDYSQVTTVNPATGVAWTHAELVAFTPGLMCYPLGGSVPRGVRCTQFWVVVDYTPPTRSYGYIFG